MFSSLMKNFFSSKPTRHGFRPAQSLPECFELANSEIYTRSHGFLRNRAYQFFSKDNRIERVSEYVKKQFGLTNFQYIGCGDNAIVARYSEFQVLRFRAPAVEAEVNTHNVLKSPFICPVWKEVEFERARLDFVPYIVSLAVKVAAGVIPRSVAEEYMFSLLLAGFVNEPPMWFFDYKNYDHKFEQVGLLADGTPIIIDQGSVILAADTPKERLARLNEDKRLVFARSMSAVLSWDGTWFDNKGREKIASLPRPSEP